jgi:hypothetical protein
MTPLDEQVNCIQPKTHTMLPPWVDVPNLVTYLTQPLTLELYVSRCGSKNKDEKEIGLRVRNTITNIYSTVNIIKGNIYDHLKITRFLTLTMKRTFF